MHAQRSSTVHGPPSAQIPVFRDLRTQDKLFVEVRLEDGKNHLFLVDTGSSVSVVSRQIANALDLNVELRPGRLVGLSGSAPWQASTLDTLLLGPYSMRDVEVAVDVPGVPKRIGLVPLAGILGNNVWSQFQLAIDYPANVMELSRGEMDVPETAEPMFFNGQHPLVRATLLSTQREAIVRQPAILEVDTGARGLMIIGQSLSGLSDVATEGEELIIGIGSAHDASTNSNLQPTRRVIISETHVGGVAITRPISATWMSYTADRPSNTQPGMPGLLGYEVFRDHRLVLDFIGRRFALAKPGPASDAEDVHAWYLRYLERQRDADARVEAVRVHLWLGQLEEGRRLLARLVSKSDPHPGAVVLQARIHRKDGERGLARELLETLTVRELSEQGEIVAWVNTLWLDGDTEQAVEIAQTATILAPDEVSSWVAFADALRAAGQRTDARKAIAHANRLNENPDGHLLRRSWLAVEEGDTNAALTHLRRLLELQPGGGVAQWLYSMQGVDARHKELIRQDLTRAQQRLHEGQGPLDFMAAAWRHLGDQQRAEDLMEMGLKRDCARAPTSANRDNCEAWYHALIGRDLDDARARIERAIAADPKKSEFLDTLAIVLEAQGDLPAARAAAYQAAAHAPADVYLILQAARLDTEARKADIRLP